MATRTSAEKALRLALQVSLGVALIAIVVAVMFYMQNNDLQGQVAAVNQSNSDAAAAGKKANDDLRAAKAQMADMTKKAADAEKLRVALGRIEPQLTPILEAAAIAKGNKPDVRANALAAAGIIGQVVHGPSDDAALALLDRALAQDKTNCIAGLAENLSGTKQVALDPGCEPLAAPAAATGATPTPAGASAAAAPAAASSAAASSAAASSTTAGSAAPAPAAKN